MGAITEDAAREAAGRETAKLYRAHGGAIYRYTLHTLGSREDAEDATQAAFASAHAALARGTKVREPRAWLFRIAHHECVGRITERRARPVVLDGDLERPDDGASVDRTFQAQRTVQDVMAAVSALPPQQRDALVLREWSGLSVTEVAAALDSSVPAVNALLHRARRSVLATVAGHDEAVGCRHTRDCLEANKLDLAARAHLVRCAECRGLRRTVLPQPVGGFAIVPPAILAARLGDLLPGFAGGGGGGALAIGGGTGLAAILGKAAALPSAAKVTAAVVASAVAVGGTVEGVREIERHGGDVAPIEAASAAEEPGGGTTTLSTTAAATAVIAAATVSTTSSAPETADDHGGRGRGGDDEAGDDHSGRGRGGDDGADDDRSGKGGGDDAKQDDDRSGKGGGDDDRAKDDRSGKGKGDDGAKDDDRSGKGGGDDRAKDDDRSGRGGDDAAKADDDRSGSGSGSGSSGRGGEAKDDDEPASTSSDRGGGGSSGGGGSDDDGSGGSGSSGGDDD